MDSATAPDVLADGATAPDVLADGATAPDVDATPAQDDSQGCVVRAAHEESAATPPTVQPRTSKAYGKPIDVARLPGLPGATRETLIAATKVERELRAHRTHHSPQDF